MTLATTALALYARTRAQLHHLTSPTTLAADYNHPQCAVLGAFPLHRPTTRRRRRARPVTNAIRRLLTACFPLPSPRPVRLVPEKPPCRLCAAIT
jgi:hypothetical protein